MRKLILMLALTMLLGGCLVGPNYRSPPIQVCDNWNAAAPPICPPSDPPPAYWWNLFCDPLLTCYIDRAAFNNKDLLTAEANIWQARAIRQSTASALFPRVNGDLIALRSYFGKDSPFFAAQGTQMTLPFEIPKGLTLYGAMIDASWEIDLFGKTRRSIESADYQIEAHTASRDDVLISIEAEVARNYMELRSAQRRGELIAADVALLEKSLAIAKKKLEVGYTNRLDYDRIEAELLVNEANLPRLIAQIYQNIYAISVLTGDLPETLLCELLPIQPLPCVPEPLCIGLRSDLIRRRPDIRVAERNLAAATANIGVAVASFFPSFKIFGGVGFLSNRLSNLFQAQSITSTIAGNVSLPLFEGGNLVGNLRLSEAKAVAAAFAYQQSVLRGLQEAETALMYYTEELQASCILKKAAQKYEELVSLTQARYSKGLIQLTDLLDIQRQWNGAEQNLLTSQTNALIDVITLYKALGGGWECVE